MEDHQHDQRAAWSENTALAHLPDSSLLELWRAIVTELSRRAGSAAPVCSMEKIQLRPLEGFILDVNEPVQVLNDEPVSSNAPNVVCKFPCRLDFCVTSPGHRLDVRSRIQGVAQYSFNAHSQPYYDIILDEPFTIETSRLTVPLYSAEGGQYMGMAESYSMEVTITCLKDYDASALVTSLQANRKVFDYKPASELSICATLPDLLVCPTFDVNLPLRCVRPEFGTLKYGMGVDASWTRQLPHPRQNTCLPCLVSDVKDDSQHASNHAIEYALTHDYGFTYDRVINETRLKCIFCLEDVVFGGFDILLDHYRAQHKDIRLSVTSHTTTADGIIRVSISMNICRHFDQGLGREVVPPTTDFRPFRNLATAHRHESPVRVDDEAEGGMQNGGYDSSDDRGVHDEVQEDTQAAIDSQILTQEEITQTRGETFELAGKHGCTVTNGVESGTECQCGIADKTDDTSTGFEPPHKHPTPTAAYRESSPQPCRTSQMRGDVVMNEFSDRHDRALLETGLDYTVDNTGAQRLGSDCGASLQLQRETFYQNKASAIFYTDALGQDLRKQRTTRVENVGAGGVTRKRKRGTMVDELQDLVSPKRILHTLPDIPGVTFYHASSKQAASKGDHPGEGEGPAEEMRFEHGRRRAFIKIGLSEAAIRFHNAFHRHLDLEKPTSRHFVKQAIMRFARKHRNWLRIAAWHFEFEAKLQLLEANRFLDRQTVDYCLTCDGTSRSLNSSATPGRQRYDVCSSVDMQSQDSGLNLTPGDYAHGMNNKHQRLVRSYNTSFRTEVPESPDADSTYDPVSSMQTPTSSVRGRRPRILLRNGQLDHVEGWSNGIVPRNFKGGVTPEYLSELRSSKRLGERVLTPSLSPHSIHRAPLTRQSWVGMADFIMGRTPKPSLSATSRFDSTDLVDSERRCFCGHHAAEGRGSVACSDTNCVRETFHLACVGLARALPHWKCSDCTAPPEESNISHDGANAEAPRFTAVT